MRTSTGFHPCFILDMARSPGFGCRHTYKFALFRLAFAVDPDLLFILHVCTNSQAHSSIGTASGFNALCHLVSVRFQELFHSPPGVLFTFPSRYLFAIGHRRVFSLGGWSPLLPAGFHVSGGTLGLPRDAEGGSRTGLSPAAAGLPMPFRSLLGF